MDLGSAVGRIRLDFDGAGAQQAIGSLNALERAGAGLADSLNVAGKTLLGVGAAIGAPLGLAAGEAIGFGREMANVNSILQLSDAGIAELGDEVQALSGVVAKSPQELAAGLYDIASSGFTGAEGL